MYKYKLNIPNSECVLEFESKFHVSDLFPIISEEGMYLVKFADASVALNLAKICEIEINGQIYILNLHD